MPKIKTKPAKYKKDDKVYSSLKPNQTLTISEDPQWNGLTWMYSFEGTDLRCGQDYLKDINYITN